MTQQIRLYINKIRDKQQEITTVANEIKAYTSYKVEELNKLNNELAELITLFLIENEYKD